MFCETPHVKICNTDITCYFVACWLVGLHCLPQGEKEHTLFCKSVCSIVFLDHDTGESKKIVIGCLCCPIGLTKKHRADTNRKKKLIKQEEKKLFQHRLYKNDRHCHHVVTDWFVNSHSEASSLGFWLSPKMAIWARGWR